MTEKYIEKFKNEIQVFHSGDSYKSYEFLGVHPFRNGFVFAVWAPNAERVSLCGEFNGWNPESDVMSEKNGIWYIYTEKVKENDIYKYGVLHNGKVVMKSDPYAFYSQVRPDTASVVRVVDKEPVCREYESVKNGRSIFNSPVNIYEVHLGSFMTKDDGEFYSYREMAPKLTNYLIDMGYNFVELMPLMEYPLDASWGYQTTGYYSLTSRYGEPEDFQFMVDMLHKAGIGVIMDWVPGHFCKDAHGLYRFDGTPLFEYKNENLSDNPGWGTYNFDFTKPEVVSFLISNAIFWMEYYGIDGLRVDAVANMLFTNFGKGDKNIYRNEYGTFENLGGIKFIKKLNETVHKVFPHNIMCAEDSSDWPKVTRSVSNGGLGFDFKWNMGWMNDSLSYIKLDPIYRKFMHKNLTFGMCYAFSENFILPISHDEVVHGKCSLVEKMPGYRVDKFAQVRSFMTYMYGMPGKKLLFMGSEFAHSLEWRFYESLEWKLMEFQEYAGMKYSSSDLNHIYLENKAMWQNDSSWDGFCWCDANDSEKSILSFARMSDDRENVLIFIINFTPMKYEKMAVGVPFFSDYEEIYSSDNAIYGGNNIVNRGIIVPQPVPKGEQSFSVNIDIPPYGGIILKKTGNKFKQD